MTELPTARDEVAVEWASLRLAWSALREQWRDDVAARFEQERWSEWERIVPAYLAALRDLADVVSDVLREI